MFSTDFEKAIYNHQCQGEKMLSRKPNFYEKCLFLMIDRINFLDTCRVIGVSSEEARSRSITIAI